MSQATELPADRHHIGKLIRDARTRARMSRAALARHAGLSESTIKNAETGHSEVTAHTLRSLLSVPELELPDELGARPNAWYAPGFSPVAEFKTMLATLQGAGGTIEQSLLYFDHASAVDWCAISSQRDYVEADRTMPLERAAEQVFHLLHRVAGAVYSAKDFRTFAGTVRCAQLLIQCGPCTARTQARKNVVQAIKQVAQRLGNTPAICRRCYVHPAVLEAYLGGELPRLLGREMPPLPGLGPDELQLLALLGAQGERLCARAQVHSPASP